MGRRSVTQANTRSGRYEGHGARGLRAIMIIVKYYIDGLAQDCDNSSAKALELPQSCAKPSMSKFTVDLALYISI